MLSYRIARRSFIRGAGASAFLLPLLRNLEGQAQGLPTPVRFLVLHHPLGTMRDQWVPSVNGASFTLNHISNPFEPLRSHMVMIDGVDIVCANGGDNTHEGGMVALVTGQPAAGLSAVENDFLASGPSIDQIFLKQSPKLGGTQFGSLELAADNRSDFDSISPRVMSYDAPTTPGQRLPRFPSIRPLEVYNRIFSGALPSTNPDQLTQLRAQKRSILDYMKTDLARLRTLAPAEESVKLDSHAEAIRKLELGLDQTLSVNCQATPAPATFPDNPDYFNINQPAVRLHADVGQAQLSLMRAAFACDLARVGTFMWAPGTSHVVFGGLYNGMNPGEHHASSHDTTAEQTKFQTEVGRFYAEQTSSALQLFANTPDPMGTGSLLDNTIVVSVSEIARGYDHDMSGVPLMIFGGPGVQIQGGRFLAAGPKRPMNDVWLALAPVFGVNLQSLGDSSQYTGALPGIVG